VDACAGPIAQPIPIKEYLKKAIDPVTVQLYATTWPGYDLEFAEEIDPITELKEGEVHSDKDLPIIALFQNNASQRQNPNPMAVPIPELAATITTAIQAAQPGTTGTLRWMTW
jgi:hypothetical protein